MLQTSAKLSRSDAWITDPFSTKFSPVNWAICMASIGYGSLSPSVLTVIPGSSRPEV